MSNRGIPFGVVILSASIVAAAAVWLYKSEESSDGSVNLSFGQDSDRVVCISAPGKVLIAGGYLVLERPNIGVTVAATSRFFTTIQLGGLESNISIVEGCVAIVVQSPQFYSEYKYSYDYIRNRLTSSSTETNGFVEKCLALTLAFISRYLTSGQFHNILGAIAGEKSLNIVLLADNDFYSQTLELNRRGLPLLSSSLEALPKFMPCPRDESGNVKIAKTGLGSSAALTTSLVGALLQWFRVIKISNCASAEDCRVVHNLAQLVHGNAQGKIGSGFDVAAAVYGTQIYQRFCAESFSDCLQDPVDAAKIYRAVMTPNAAPDSETGWCHQLRSFSLPPGMDIVLGDVCGGTSSTSMARKVLTWRKSDPESADKLWKELAEINAAIFACLADMNRHHHADAHLYDWCLKWASEHTAEDWNQLEHYVTVLLLIRLRSLFTQARRALKTMGDSAGVDIEPDSQTALADATAAEPGVVSAGVPGAGGVDALFAITLSEASRKRVEKLWSKWSDSSSDSTQQVCPLILRAGGGSSAGIMAHENIVYQPGTA